MGVSLVGMNKSFINIHHSRFLVMLMFSKLRTVVAIITSILVLNLPLVIAQSVNSYIPVPHHYQVNDYYCGPASLEMVFDFYGPDIPQWEIADAALTSYLHGTFTYGMRRAAHFSNLSRSRGDELPWSITGYSQRKLGYAAFEHGGFTMDELKWLINEGYPIIIATWLGYFGHFRVVVGYNGTHVGLRDPLWHQIVKMTHTQFLRVWEYSYYWGLFVSPWNVTGSTAKNVREGEIFTVTTTVTYPCPPPFHTSKYPASSSSATITLSEGLTLVSGETSKKTIGTGNLAAGSSATVSWILRADDPGTYNMSIMAEGIVAGSFPYSYNDRIGGCSNVIVTVNPQSPMEAIEELVQTIEIWNLGNGIKTSLTSKLQATHRLLDRENQNAPLGQLTAFINEVKALKEKKLASEQADYLTAEAQRIIDLIRG